MDGKTLEAMGALGVEIKTEGGDGDAAKSPLTKEQIDVAIKELEEKKANTSDEPEVKEPIVGPEANKEDVEIVVKKDEVDVGQYIEPTAEPSTDTTPEEPKIDGDDSIKPDEDKVPNIEENSEANPEANQEVDLDEALAELEEFSKDNLDVEEKTNEIKDKIEKAKDLVQGSPEHSKAVKEIVDLNVKLQQEAAILKMSDEAKDKKILELTEAMNDLKFDDSKVFVPDELKTVNNYFTKFKETSNETFKIKAIQEAVNLVESLTGKPLKGDYLDDYIEDSLKSIEKLTKEQHDTISRQEAVVKDPKLEWAITHGVDI